MNLKIIWKRDYIIPWRSIVVFAILFGLVYYLKRPVERTPAEKMEVINLTLEHLEGEMKLFKAIHFAGSDSSLWINADKNRKNYNKISVRLSEIERKITRLKRERDSLLNITPTSNKKVDKF